MYILITKASGRLKKEKENVDSRIIKEEVVETSRRDVIKVGDSRGITIPCTWKRFLEIPILELELVRREGENNSGKYSIVISIPGREMRIDGRAE